MKLEVACFNLDSVAIVAQSKADRVEFCDNFEAGGTTPSFEDTQKARLLFSKELFVMIRPRGGDFNYSEEEFNQMKQSILEMKNTGINGFVFGILDQNNSIDFEKNSELVAAMRHYDVTVNITWVMGHFNAAKKYIESIPGSHEATGGSDWKKYMLPKYQKRIFFPKLWSKEELDNWGE